MGLSWPVLGLPWARLGPVLLLHVRELGEAERVEVGVLGVARRDGAGEPIVRERDVLEGGGALGEVRDRAGELVEVEVELDEAARALEPFYSSRPDGKGLGLVGVGGVEGGVRGMGGWGLVRKWGVTCNHE